MTLHLLADNFLKIALKIRAILGKLILEARQMRSKFLVTVQLIAFLVSAGISRADVISGVATSSGDSFQIISPPVNALDNNVNVDHKLFAFNEKQNVYLTSALAVDSLNGGGAGTIAAGTWVSSQMVFFDPLQGSSITGKVNFDGTVLGLITSVNNLGASNYLGAAGTNYQLNAASGLEPGDVVIRDTGSDITIDWNTSASSPGDWVRVITAVPLPSAAWGGLVLLAIFGISRGLKARRAC